MRLESQALKRFVDIDNGRWETVMAAGVLCGWSPAGTDPPQCRHGLDYLTWWQDPGQGRPFAGYATQEWQRLMPRDAAALAEALDRAADRIDAGDVDALVARDPRCVVPRRGVSLPARPLTDLVGCAPRVRMLAAFLREATVAGDPILLSPPVGLMMPGIAVATAEGTRFLAA
jgi:hypothetical protein